ncbi:hypothetical protein NIES2119_09875 [[Phormidium ambiguum] IAM M-71]|uniref:Uncharacterized protein n=1 Tax=[Phormidium ambiguum] IAM M-71 TaxID=454136 RepID=A0A1U7IM99_9CYAN|nr:hypothetical protein [Phormidium ambiguum]OKH38335.1 hypothetical protein NIES2119_09875 [Phormidium ambiguum IAM M-71]
MSRRTCPQHFDCLEMGAEKGLKCPIRNFCLEVKELGGIQELPYYINTIRDALEPPIPENINVLRVKYQYDIERRQFFLRLGWMASIQIPYLMRFYPEENLRIMMVFTVPIYCGEDGFWASAEELPREYFSWMAAKLSTNWQEYKTQFDEIQNNQSWYYKSEDYIYE